jgi:hypothetical protein
MKPGGEGKQRGGDRRGGHRRASRRDGWRRQGGAAVCGHWGGEGAAAGFKARRK